MNSRTARVGSVSAGNCACSFVELYALRALEAGCASVCNVPVFIASLPAGRGQVQHDNSIRARSARDVRAD